MISVKTKFIFIFFFLLGILIFFYSSNEKKIAIQNITDIQNLDENFILINFWAPWCKPCFEEIPDIVNFHDSNENKDLIVVGPSFGDKVNTNEVIKKLNIKYHVFLAGSDEVEFMEANGNPDFKLPQTILIDPEKNQTFSKIGILQDKDFKLIKKILNE